jgi:hypothetical protein
MQMFSMPEEAERAEALLASIQLKLEDSFAKRSG